jgi:thiol-disulfide isomerase/thioredoxin
MIRIVKLFSFLILLTLTCTTKDGIEFAEKYGQLWIVTTEADSARIFLDYRDTGFLTPSLLENIILGKHAVHLFRNGYKTSPDSAIVFLQEDQTDTVSIELVSSLNGNLSINSSPDSARVIINRLEFGITPITIEGLPVGIYFLEIIKGGFNVASDTIEMLENDNLQLIYQLAENLRRFVLLEHFSNTSCPPCPTSDEIIHDLAESYGPSRLVVLGYHANYPSPSDPMYLAARAANDRRIQFYQPASLPRAYVDGQLVSDPLSSSCYQNLIESQLIADTLAFIAFQQLNLTNTLVQGQLKVKALSDINSGHRLFIALIEDEIHYNTPPGTNGQTHFDAVLRGFYPDGNGITINLLNQESQTIEFEISLKAEWGQDLTALAFIQNVSTKAVLQSAWTRYPEF